MSKIGISVIVLLVMGALLLFLSVVGILRGKPMMPVRPDGTANNFEECISAGYPVMESYPRQCRAGDDLFIEEIAEEEPVSQSDGCKRTGCSGQICSDEEVVTTCEFRPEYICYENAVCERQSNGECGWTMISELAGCLEGAEP